MKCNKYKRLISLYVDGEITADKQTELLLHLETCRICKEEFDKQKSLILLLSPPEDIQPNPWFLNKLQNKITQQKTGSFIRDSLLKYVKPVLTAALCSVIIVISFLIGSSIGSQLEKSKSPDENSIIQTFKNTMNFSVFDSIPQDSIAYKYFDLFQEKEK